jgi:hypothetical protein
VGAEVLDEDDTVSDEAVALLAESIAVERSWGEEGCPLNCSSAACGGGRGDVREDNDDEDGAHRMTRYSGVGMKSVAAVEQQYWTRWMKMGSGGSMRVDHAVLSPEVLLDCCTEDEVVESKTKRKAKLS